MHEAPRRLAGPGGDDDDDDDEPAVAMSSRTVMPPPYYPPWPSRRGALPVLAHVVVWLLVAALLLVQPASAAQVSFVNCLPDNYLYAKNPVLLQWVPLYVDASFDTQHPKHTLRVTMYGNVTGTRTNATLPPWNSPDWHDPNKTDGKILREPQPGSDDPKLTTLHSRMDFLSYEPWNNDTDFCATALTNASCPLGPVFNQTAMYVARLLLPTTYLPHPFVSPVRAAETDILPPLACSRTTCRR